MIRLTVTLSKINLLMATPLTGKLIVSTKVDLLKHIITSISLKAAHFLD